MRKRRTDRRQKTVSPVREESVLLVMPAAGKGTRLDLPVPKPLVKIGEIPLFQYPLRGFPQADLALVIRPEHESQFRQALKETTQKVFFRFQPDPRGMAEAVARTLDLWPSYGVVVVLWADLVWLTRELGETLLSQFLGGLSEMAVPAFQSAHPYVRLHCNEQLEIDSAVEAREGTGRPAAGWADLGVFFLRPSLKPLFEAYLENRGWGIGSQTGEKNFLPFLEYLYQQGRPAQLIPVSTAFDLVGINSREELERFRAILADKGSS